MAREAFAECGYGSVAVKEVANRCGASSSTFYNYFVNKERLFDAVLLDAFGGLIRGGLSGGNSGGGKLTGGSTSGVGGGSGDVDERVTLLSQAVFTPLAEDSQLRELVYRSAHRCRMVAHDPAVLAAVQGHLGAGGAPEEEAEMAAAGLLGTGLDPVDRWLRESQLLGCPAPCRAETVAAMVSAGIRAQRVARQAEEAAALPVAEAV